MADGIEVIRALADPVGQVTSSWTRPNGMTIERVRVPLGVIGIIYESRPNVTADAGALTLKSGNAVILRGGSDGHRSSRAIHAALAKGLREANLPEDAISLVPTRDRAAVGMMLQGPRRHHRRDRAARRQEPGRARAGRSARAGVRASRRRLPRLCRQGRRLDMAKTIVLNAKMRRTGVCGAAETLLVDRAAAATHLKPLIAMLIDAGCEVRGDAAVQERRRARQAGERGGLVDRISRRHHHRRRGRRRRCRDRAYRALRLAPHRRHRHRRPEGGGEIPRARSIRRSCCTTPRPSSPTAANSASAPRSASPPAGCMRAARSASSSSPASSIACAARGRSGREPRSGP